MFCLHLYKLYILLLVYVYTETIYLHKIFFNKKYYVVILLYFIIFCTSLPQDRKILLIYNSINL